MLPFAGDELPGRTRRAGVAAGVVAGRQPRRVPARAAPPVARPLAAARAAAAAGRAAASHRQLRQSHYYRGTLLFCFIFLFFKMRVTIGGPSGLYSFTGERIWEIK